MTVAEYTLEHGGGTFRVVQDYDAYHDAVFTFTAVNPATGYSVALAPNDPARRVRLNASRAGFGEGAMIESLARQVAQNFPLAQYIGTWINDSIVYVDPVGIIETPEIAAKLGRQTGQKAIYSFADQEDVPL